MGYQKPKGFWDPSTYSWEKMHICFEGNFGTHCRKAYFPCLTLAVLPNAWRNTNDLSGWSGRQKEEERYVAFSVASRDAPVPLIRLAAYAFDFERLKLLEWISFENESCKDNVGLAQQSESLRSGIERIGLLLYFECFCVTESQEMALLTPPLPSTNARSSMLLQKVF